ncbi:hypothetical protein IWZ03DRAFT_426062 [Phyllosticta citriasiana]|uniref:Uncharacterized protein n=1 Tax=Phyllosticta citriasiana TaxID=595635 RepID=A0ABR1KCI8_9PEZI
MEASGAPFVHYPLQSRKKHRHTSTTAALFKARNFQHKPSKLSKGTTVASSSPTKHSLTSKPQGIHKRRLKPNATRVRQKAEVAKHKQRNALSLEFNETAKAYRKTVVNDANALLRSARKALLTRLSNTTSSPSTPAKQQPRAARGPFLAASPASDDNDDDDNDGNYGEQLRYEPTLLDLCHSHNREVAKLQDPLADEQVEYEDDVLPMQASAGQTRRIGDAMEEFRGIVAEEEENLRGLEKEWDAVQSEIEHLARSIFNDAASDHDYDANGRGEERSAVLDLALVERLRREVIEVADEFDGRVGEVRDAEKALKRRQERFLADTIRSMGDL